MSNLTEMRGRLRRELGDETQPYTWGDTLLNDLLREAGDWYSKRFPRQGTAYREVERGQRRFPLPPGNLGVVGVECPLGNLLPKESATVMADPTPYLGRMRQAWSVWDEGLVLRNGASGDEVSKEPGEIHLAMRLYMPWMRLDPIEPWDGPYEDERLLVLMAASEAYAWLDGQDQRLGRAQTTTNGILASWYGKRLASEVEDRRKRAGCREMDVVR